jgi:hypothetical protein
MKAFDCLEFGRIIVSEIVKLSPDERVIFYRVLANVSAQFGASAKEPVQKKYFDRFAMQWMRLAEWAEAEAKEEGRRQQG